MKSPKIRRVVVIVGTTALFGAAGCGSSSPTNATSNATAAGGAAQQQGAPAGRPGGLSAADLSTPSGAEPQAGS
jgi:hypothetical protein